MNHINLTEDQWDKLIEAAPSEEDRRAAYDTLVGDYKAKTGSKVKGFPWEFDTCGDKQLEDMFYKVRKFAYDFLMSPIKEMNITPYWLTLTGKSETGKSHLTMRLGDFLQEFGEVRCVPRFSYDDLFPQKASVASLKASQISNDSQVFNAAYKTGLGQVTALIMDDLNPDVHPWVKRDLCNILMLRSGEGINPFLWTVITTNMTREQVSDQYDPRIASRMRRGDNIIVELGDDVTPFLDRSQGV